MIRKRPADFFDEIMLPNNPPLLGMTEVVSEDAVRRAYLKIEEAAGLVWPQKHLDYATRPLLSDPWILDPRYRHHREAAQARAPVAQLSQPSFGQSAAGAGGRGCA
jgi:hypothetical protein